jgi:hypothetical protein
MLRSYYAESITDAGQNCRRKINLGYEGIFNLLPIPVAKRSEAWVCGRSLAGIVGSNPAGGMDVSRECCILLDSLCVGLFTREEDS